MILFSLHIYKGNKKMGIIKGKGTWEYKENREWVSIWHTHRAKSVELSIMIHILHAGILPLDASMKLVLLFCLPVTIQSM
jgi:hypothetical protein